MCEHDTGDAELTDFLNDLLKMGAPGPGPPCWSELVHSVDISVSMERIEQLTEHGHFPVEIPRVGGSEKTLDAIIDMAQCQVQGGDEEVLSLAET